MKIKELIKLSGIIKKDIPLKNFEVKGVTCDSRCVKNSFIFVAIHGSRQDGHKFIKEAIRRGAGAVIVELGMKKAINLRQNLPVIELNDTRKALAKLAVKFYRDPSSKIKVVGITGTNGKTTVSYLIEAILKKANFLPAVIGTINYRFKNKLLPSGNTTPGPVELQSMLAEMQKDKATHLLLEVSSHALEQNRTEGIRFNSAIFTNLTQDHLDYHNTMEDYFKAKAKLFKGLTKPAYAVINRDDRFGRKIIKFSRVKVITYGLKRSAMVRAEKIKLYSTHSVFMLFNRKTKVNFRTNLIGRHNIYNILAATAWAIEAGIDILTIKAAIDAFSLVPGRLQRVDCKRKFSVFIDYAHTEDALNNVISALRMLCDKKLIVVFGCGGERDRAKRPKMGRVTSELADYCIITNDNPRSESPDRIISDIKSGIKKRNFTIIPDRYEAIKKAICLAKQGDIVLIAGKGHEDYQIINNKKLCFSDRKAITECLR